MSIITFLLCFLTHPGRESQGSFWLSTPLCTYLCPLGQKPNITLLVLMGCIGDASQFQLIRTGLNFYLKHTIRHCLRESFLPSRWVRRGSSFLKHMELLRTSTVEKPLSKSPDCSKCQSTLCAKSKPLLVPLVALFVKQEACLCGFQRCYQSKLNLWGGKKAMNCYPNMKNCFHLIETIMPFLMHICIYIYGKQFYIYT